MSRKPTVVSDGDNPEWTKQDFARGRRGDDIPAHIRTAFPKTRGRPAASAKQLLSLRIDCDTIDRFRPWLAIAHQRGVAEGGRQGGSVAGRTISASGADANGMA